MSPDDPKPAWARPGYRIRLAVLRIGQAAMGVGLLLIAYALVFE